METKTLTLDSLVEKRTALTQHYNTVGQQFTVVQTQLKKTETTLLQLKTSVTTATDLIGEDEEVPETQLEKLNTLKTQFQEHHEVYTKLMQDQNTLTRSLLATSGAIEILNQILAENGFEEVVPEVDSSETGTEKSAT